MLQAHTSLQHRISSKKPLLISAVSAVFWMTLFLFFRRQMYLPAPEGCGDKWANMMNTIFHASWIGPSAALYLLGRLSSAQWTRVIHITRGYFYYDLFCLVLFPATSDSTQELCFFVFHHVILLLLLTLVASYPRTIAIGFLAEIPMPFLCGVWYLDEWGAYDSMLYYPLGVCALILYFVFRVCNLTYLFASRVQIKKDNMRMKSMVCLPILFLNYYWFYVMVTRAVASLTA